VPKELYKRISRRNSIIKTEKITVPHIPQKLSQVEVTMFHDEEYIHDCLIENCTIDEHQAMNIDISQVVFRNVVFNHICWPFAKITDAIFERCDLSNMNFNEGFMDQVQLTSCKLVGANMTEAYLKRTLFTACNAAYSILSHARCKKITFHETSFSEANFYSTTLEDVNFENCNLDKAQFSKTKLRGIDLSSCQFYQLGLNPDDLRGCIIAPDQAIALANIFGVILKK